jgi:hypothetical protein
MKRFFDALVAHAPRRAASRLLSTPAASQLAHLLTIMRGIIDEWTDQNAYRRHLAAHGAKDSAAEWRRFSDERYRSKSTRARCC